MIDVPKAVDVLVIDGDAKRPGRLLPGHGAGARRQDHERAEAADRVAALLARSCARSVSRRSICSTSSGSTRPKSPRSRPTSRPAAAWAFFLGELSRADFFNEQLYRDGEGLFPLPLAGPAELLVDRLEKSPDLEVTDHPIFSVFAGERNSFLNTVVGQPLFRRRRRTGSPRPIRSTKVIARLRNKAPLAVEQQVWRGARGGHADQGLAGRDLAGQLEQLGPRQSQLRRGAAGDAIVPVGAAPSRHRRGWSARRWTCQLDVAQYLPQVRFVDAAREPAAARSAVDAAATADGTRAPCWPIPTPAASTRRSSPAPTARSASSDSPSTSRPTRAICTSSMAEQLAGAVATAFAIEYHQVGRHQLQPAATGRLQSEREPAVCC